MWLMSFFVIFFFLEIYIICIYVIIINFLFYNSQSLNRIFIILEQLNGIVLWNVNFSFFLEYLEQMLFNVYFLEVLVKVNVVCDFFG